MNLQLTGRTAFVAAASRGLGLAIAEAFCREGADIGICARDGDVLAAAAAGLRSHGTRVVAAVADVTQAAQMEAAVAETCHQTGRLDCLVINAGGPPTGRFTELDDAAWLAAMELTLLSAVRLVRLALPWLSRSDAASITVVSSLSVRQPIDNLLLSNSLRGAVAGLAKTLSRELAPTVRVNTLLTGSIRTGRTEALAAADVTSDHSLDQVLEQRGRAIPLQRYGDPAEFARVAVFVASPMASYLTGTALAVDGGALAATV